VFSCDYNGWADVPEEEREGIDAFEATILPSPDASVFITDAIHPQLLPALWYPGSGLPTRRAA
jgi:hypothetical protein